MSEPWRDINDPGFFCKPTTAPADNTRVAATDELAKPKEKLAPIATLSDAKFVPPQADLKFNDKCPVQVSVQYKEQTPQTRVTFKLFCNYNGDKQDLSCKVDANERNGVAKAELQLFYPDGYNDGPVDFFFTAEHCGGDKVVESGKLTLPKSQKHIFPMRTRPSDSYHDGSRKFGADRDNGRKHAGCDLYAPIGTDILAVKDGVITKGPSEFAGGTYALEVDHGDILVRYAEIKGECPEGIKIGATVKQGQVIAYVGKFVTKHDGIKHMLHFELYSKKATGPLTRRDNPPFQRRSDLVDPTDFLDKAELIKQ